MNENFAIQLFEGKKVRIVWDVEQEKYYFCNGYSAGLDRFRESA